MKKTLIYLISSFLILSIIVFTSCNKSEKDKITKSPTIFDNIKNVSTTPGKIFKIEYGNDTPGSPSNIKTNLVSSSNPTPLNNFKFLYVYDGAGNRHDIYLDPDCTPPLINEIYIAKRIIYDDTNKDNLIGVEISNGPIIIEDYSKNQNKANDIYQNTFVFSADSSDKSFAVTYVYISPEKPEYSPSCNYTTPVTFTINKKEGTPLVNGIVITGDDRLLPPNDWTTIDGSFKARKRHVSQSNNIIGVEIRDAKDDKKK